MKILGPDVIYVFRLAKKMEILKGVASGLAHLHQEKIIHRYGKFFESSFSNRNNNKIKKKN